MKKVGSKWKRKQPGDNIAFALQVVYVNTGDDRHARAEVETNISGKIRPFHSEKIDLNSTYKKKVQGNHE